jgi:hypothetical protein
VPKPGDILKILETDYLHGLGDLVLRVTEVRSVEWLSDGDWLDITGVQLGWNGSDIGERQVLVRLSSLSKRQGRA